MLGWIARGGSKSTKTNAVKGLFRSNYEVRVFLRLNTMWRKVLYRLFSNILKTLLIFLYFYLYCDVVDVDAQVVRSSYWCHVFFCYHSALCLLPPYHHCHLRWINSFARLFKCYIFKPFKKCVINLTGIWLLKPSNLNHVPFLKKTFAHKTGVGFISWYILLLVLT